MKVWSSSSLTDIISQNQRLLASYISESYLPESNFRVAIIGGGPKGSYAIERLASVWNTHCPGKFLDIVCFNSSADFGSGPNYQTRQPDFLLMNYNLGKVDFWTDEPEQLVFDRPDLREFLERFKNESETEVDAEDYCSRAITGVYLQYCLCKVIDALPPNIRLHLVVDEVKSISEISDSLMLDTGSGMHFGFSEVMCCTGHSYRFGKEYDSRNSIKKISDVSPLIQTVYPAENLQKKDLKGKVVAIKGMGLTFVDAVLALTEGKGGVFKRENGSLRYMASGKEPSEILPFCRTGLPMIARKEDFNSADFSLRFFTEETVQYLLSKHDKLDFKLHLLPFIQREFRFQYVVHLLRFRCSKNIQPEKTLPELELYASGIYPDFEPFDLEEFLSPELPALDFHNAVVNYLRQTVFPENCNEMHQSKIAMSALWRKINPILNTVYSFGKLTGESQRYFDQHYYGRFQRVSFGPPKENMEKILALAEVGLLQFDLAYNPKVSIKNQSSALLICHRQASISKSAVTLIDARIPKSGGLATQPEYIKKLVLQMKASFFVNEKYKTGCLEIDQSGRLIKQKQICFYGTPTEGWTLDNESLSRANNNFLSPWANQISKNYVNIKDSKVNTNYPLLDQGANS